MHVYGDGKREQNFIYAGEIVRIIEKCVIGKVSGIYNAVSEKNISMIDLAELIVSITNSKSKIVIDGNIAFNDRFKPNYDLERLKRELSYKPVFSLNKALTKYCLLVKREWRMKIALIADIHSNFFYFQEVYSYIECEQVDLVYCPRRYYWIL